VGKVAGNARSSAVIVPVEIDSAICEVKSRHAPSVVFNATAGANETVGTRRPRRHGLMGSHRWETVPIAVSVCRHRAHRGHADEGISISRVSVSTRRVDVVEV
jgi:hypothetical protein